jgi:PHD/YefM family antitoxin component YafN of YafNO toxin-antitoxin module
MRTETLAEAQRRLVDLADEVEARHDRILLVRSGHPDLALVRADELDAYREWMSFRETEDLAGDPEGQREIAESRDAYRRGDFMTIAEARARLRRP